MQVMQVRDGSDSGAEVVPSPSRIGIFLLSSGTNAISYSEGIDAFLTSHGIAMLHKERIHEATYGFASAARHSFPPVLNKDGFP